VENWQRPNPRTHPWYYYEDSVYTNLGYEIEGYVAKRPPKITDCWQSILDGSRK
jgi:hypothetical protein